ncbi:MAG TPA: hypothetical protein DCM14_08420 [Clostridiales bacterium UBA8153]|nr:hypothetical protein [Clostridiales bacterium UBA8153]
MNPQHLQRLYRDKQDARLTRTVALIHAVMHKALAQAERWGLVPRNVARLVDPPRIAAKDTLTLEEAGRLLQTNGGDRLHAL